MIAAWAIDSLQTKPVARKTGWPDAMNLSLILERPKLLLVKYRVARPVYETHCEGFDPGSERTLAAWIRHASRTNASSNTGGSGERGSNAWVPTRWLRIAVLTDG